ncbi:SWIM zinc finger family protein [Streptomyces sp. NPDC059524]|uniref:SWIM zinc finger family protein n=1 Tax=Streptomyces sp. NPDC059524 TaxID=3346856 RepID=UPI0036A8732F
MSGYDDAGAGDTRARGFAAFPARRGGRVRGQSWWAGAWADALEDGLFDADPLKEGRSAARSGRLGPVSVAPGRIAVTVHDEETHRVEITLAVLDDEEWDLLWEKLADRPAELEAVLEGTLPPDLLEAVEDARVRMLPGYGDLEAECDCDSFDHPCAHAAALAYQFGWLLDQDPFLLLLCRGRDRDEALEELRTTVLLHAMGGLDEEEDEEEEEVRDEAGVGDDREAGDSEGTGTEDDDAGRQAERELQEAAEAYARPVAPLPAPPGLPDPVDTDDLPRSGIEADPLEMRAADAAVRARALLAHALGRTAVPPPPLTPWQDTVRLAAHADARTLDRLGRASGRGERLPAAAAAWRQGAAAGLEVLEETFAPGAPVLARTRTELAEGWEEDELPAPLVQDNHWTFEERGVQLRLGRDGRWYPYRREGAEWLPSGAAGTEPAPVLAELLER